MYKVWQKRVYPKIPSIGESTPETVVETMIQSKTCVSTFYNAFLTHNYVSLSQYLEFLGRLFFAILYTYCGAHSMPVHIGWNGTMTGPSTNNSYNNLLAKLGWPINNGELSSQLASQQWVKSLKGLRSQCSPIKLLIAACICFL
jgi:hypothetical protein